MSQFFKLTFGVRQGSVLSPFLFAIYLDDIFDYRFNDMSSFIILYADDIVLLAQSVGELQHILSVCERELSWLDMNINSKKSCCIRIGPRCNIKCNDITTSSGCSLPWVTEIRYLGIHITQSQLFKCSFDLAKRAFYRSLNAIFGKIGRFASEEVIIQLVTQKCLPILLYGTEACPLNKSDLNSFDFAVNRFLMKLFKTNNITIIDECRLFFDVSLPSSLIVTRTNRFILKLKHVDNSLCQIFSGC